MNTVTATNDKDDSHIVRACCYSCPCTISSVNYYTSPAAATTTTTIVLCHVGPNLLIVGADLFVQEEEAWYTAAIAHNWNLRIPLYS